MKTRLAASVGAEQAARLARAFLSDTWAAVERLRWARPVLATTEAPSRYDLGEVEAWPQGEGDLGARMEAVARRGLDEAGRVLLLGADVPDVPGRHLTEAVTGLAAHDVVLGPSADGGFYLLAARRLPVGALAGLPWSSPSTLAATRARLESLGLTVALAPAWRDVDEAADLSALVARLESGETRAPATKRALESGRMP